MRTAGIQRLPLFVPQLVTAIGNSDGQLLVAEDSCWLSKDATPADLREYCEEQLTSHRIQWTDL